MYPTGKTAISQHLATPRFPQCDHTVGKLNANAGSLCSRPPDHKSSLNVSLPFAWITGPAKDPSYIFYTLYVSVIFFITLVLELEKAANDV
jgi:hypothetical protein